MTTVQNNRQVKKISTSDKLQILENRIRTMKKWNRVKANVVKNSWRNKMAKMSERCMIEKNKYLKQIQELKSILDTQKMKYETVLDNIFTPTQKSMLLNRKSKTHYTNLDISKALSLKFISQKAYEHVRDVWKLPLPSLRTLQM